MQDAGNIKKVYTRLNNYKIALTILWTFVVSVSLFWNIYERKQTTEELAIKEARANFEKDQAFRLWGASHGGVYVPIDRRTPPNPNLKHIPERDITTPSGRRLTLVSPAYMTRQMMEEYGKLYHIPGRVVGFKPFRPENAPDRWEASAIKSFKKGSEEVFEFTDIKNKPYIRLMRPLKAKKKCLKCHGIQGYRKGDVIGGIGISVPMAPYLEKESREIVLLTLTHILMWLLVTGGTLLAFKNLKHRIAESYRVMEALRESEEKHRLFFENSPIGIIHYSNKGIITEVNDAVITTFGSSREKLIGFNVDENPDKKFAQEIYKSLDGKPGYYEGEYTSYTGGKTSVIKAAWTPIIHKDKIISGVGIIEDITERDRIARALRHSEKTLELKNRIAHIFLIVSDDKMYGEVLQCILEVTESKYGIFGYIDRDGTWVCPSLTRDVWKRCKIADKDIRFSSESWSGIWGKAMTEKKTLCSNEPPFNVPAGHIPIQRVLDVPIIYHNELIGNVLVGNKKTDYDEQDKELLENLAEYIATVLQARLERDRKEREKKNLKAQLQHARKMESIGTMAGGIAHDFNNLLMGIQGRVSLMLMDKDSTNPDFEHMKGIEDYVKSASDLTKQLLGFARGGKYEVKSVDINELVKTQNRMFGRTKKEITIRGKYEKSLWTAKVDPGQIEQVLLNLYINAWQSMPGGGNLYVQTENVILDSDYVKPYQLSPGKYIKISVTDTGTGMDSKTKERIFDPFFTTRDMGRGTGLGLASAYGIIKNHGGFINVYSEPGEGSTFNIYLPAAESKVSVQKSEDGDDILRGNETILLVDDEDLIIDVGKQMLERLGYKVFAVKSGKEAVDLYPGIKDTVDLVILDMIMPDMGGGDVFDSLKNINPGLKVLLSSGYSINGQARAILDRGCSGFIQKPFNMNNLSRKIRKVLD